MYTVIVKDKKNSLVRQGEFQTMFEVIAFLSLFDAAQHRFYITRNG